MDYQEFRDQFVDIRDAMLDARADEFRAWLSEFFTSNGYPSIGHHVLLVDIPVSLRAPLLVAAKLAFT